MIYTTKELLDIGETEYSIRNKLKNGSLNLVERGLYSSDSQDKLNSEVYTKKMVI